MKQRSNKDPTNITKRFQLYRLNTQLYSTTFYTHSLTKLALFYSATPLHLPKTQLF